MTTTFHFETNEPRYEYSYESADVELRCEALIAVAAGPPPTFDDNATHTWFELSPVSGKQILAGVGRRVSDATMAPAFETREAMWANAMAGLGPLELAETSAVVAQCAYALVDPTTGRVELGEAGGGASALIFDGSETRLVSSSSSESGVSHSTSFGLSAGFTLLLVTHDPAEREALTSVIERVLATRRVRGDEVDAVLECCIELRNGPLSQCDSVVALHFERLDGSPVIRSQSAPPPITGEVVHSDVFATHCKSKLRIQRCERVPKPCRRQLSGWQYQPRVTRHRSVLQQSGIHLQGSDFHWRIGSSLPQPTGSVP